MNAAHRPAYDTDLLAAPSQRVMPCYGAMGTQLHAADGSLGDFNQLKGNCDRQTGRLKLGVQTSIG